MENLPRIQAVTVEGPTTLKVRWQDGLAERINLNGWIVNGGEILAALSKPDVFGRPRVADHGTAVAWDDSDLRIDAVHLQQLALDQRPT